MLGENMPTIEAATQEAILEILPEDGPLALRLMAQLVANMIISIDEGDIETFIADLRRELATFEAIEAKEH